jgi:hypothetical protein
MLRSCEGVRSWSKRTSDAFVLATTLTISSSLPWPTRLEGSGLWRRWTRVAAMVAPGRSGEFLELCALGIEAERGGCKARQVIFSSHDGGALRASRAAAVTSLRLRSLACCPCLVISETALLSEETNVRGPASYDSATPYKERATIVSLSWRVNCHSLSVCSWRNNKVTLTQL